MFKKILFLTITVATIAIYFNDYNTYVKRLFNFLPSSDKKSINLYTKEELRLYNGIDKNELYLSILGNVYDVTKGNKHYGPGQTYHFFVGRDASRSFVTGQFNDNTGLEEVGNFSHEELKSLNHWYNFYKKEYIKKGKLIGRFYNENGKLTDYGKQIKKLINEAEKAQVNADLEKQKFPPCNVEWDAEKGTRVWCSRRSGGIDRNWVGKPRQLYEPGSETYRCACISDENKNLGNIKEYEGCTNNSESCYVITQ